MRSQVGLADDLDALWSKMHTRLTVDHSSAWSPDTLLDIEKWSIDPSEWVAVLDWASEARD
eukprot:12901885-Prorocentrum_lima.AAC.1